MELQPLESIPSGTLTYGAAYRYPSAERARGTESYYPVIAAEGTVLWEGSTAYEISEPARAEAKAVFVEKIKALMELV